MSKGPQQRPKVAARVAPPEGSAAAVVKHVLRGRCLLLARWECGCLFADLSHHWSMPTRMPRVTDQLGVVSDRPREDASLGTFAAAQALGVCRRQAARDPLKEISWDARQKVPVVTDAHAALTGRHHPRHGRVALHRLCKGDVVVTARQTQAQGRTLDRCHTPVSCSCRGTKMSFT